MPLTSPPKSHFWGIYLHFGGTVAITLAPDRPNELKCYNIAFGGVIAVFKSPMCTITPWAGCQRFYAEKVPLTYATAVPRGLWGESQLCVMRCAHASLHDPRLTNSVCFWGSAQRCL